MLASEFFRRSLTTSSLVPPLLRSVPCAMIPPSVSTQTRQYVSFDDEKEEELEEALKSMKKSLKYPPSKQIRGRYISPWSGETNKKFLDVVRLFASKKPPALELGNVKNTIELIPQLEVDMDALHDVSTSHMTWMGHASCYYQTEGVYFLSDPVWSDRASPLSFAGPKRYTKPPVNVANIPIDIVLLSHTHYDHLDIDTARTIGDRALW